MADGTDSSDADLVALTLAGAHDSYKELVRRYQGHVYGLAYSVLGNWAEAQDVAQETFIRAYSNLDQLREPAKFAAWLRRVAFGVSMDWLRAFRPKMFAQLDGRVDLDHLEIPDFQPTPAEAAEKRELAEAVLAAVASLPPKYRVPLTMFHLDGLSYKKVADFLDIPLGTAKSLISRAQAKIKAILETTAKEMIPMVQEVFDEHKLPQEFAAKVLDNVPSVGWGRGKECTFAGALEAAMAVTEHPCKYSDLMGFTGLAFRVRWFKGKDGQGICPSCAVGEMDEEIAAAERAAGWQLRVVVHPGQNMSPHAPQIVASINAGKPVAAYTDDLDLSVVYGYRDHGKTFLFRDYRRGDHFEMAADKLGWMWILLGEHKPVLSRREAVVEALRIAVNNWRREVGKEGPGEYWYGPAAYRAWAGHLTGFDTLSEQKRKSLFHVNWFNMMTMVDARRAAAAFLQDNADLLEGPARNAALRAADIYRQAKAFCDADRFTKQACFLGPWSGRPISDWTAEVRNREVELLAGAERFDKAAMAELDKALAG